jgi:hypothetical protein
MHEVRLLGGAVRMLVRSYTKRRGNPEAEGWGKRSGPTEVAPIGGSNATLLDPPVFKIAPGY